MATELERILMTVLDSDVGISLKEVSKETIENHGDTLFVFSKAQLGMLIMAGIARSKKECDKVIQDLPSIEEMARTLDTRNNASLETENLKADFHKKLGSMNSALAVRDLLQKIAEEITFLSTR